MTAARIYPMDPAPNDPRFLPSPIKPASFLSPIEFIAAEHDRQLDVCAVLDRLVHNPRHGATRGEIETARDYLRQDLPLHIEDEEKDLFPLLKDCSLVNDNVDEVFALLHREHEVDDRMVQEVLRDLDVLVAGSPFPDPTMFLRNAFAFRETHRRHLAWENALILPLARQRLGKGERLELGRRMAARRGLGRVDD
jgi:hemerythrin-like domain-containing protein